MKSSVDVCSVGHKRVVLFVCEIRCGAFIRLVFLPVLSIYIYIYLYSCNQPHVRCIGLFLPGGRRTGPAGELYARTTVSVDFFMEFCFPSCTAEDQVTAPNLGVH